MKSLEVELPGLSFIESVGRVQRLRSDSCLIKSTVLPETIIVTVLKCPRLFVLQSCSYGAIDTFSIAMLCADRPTISYSVNVLPTRSKTIVSRYNSLYPQITRHESHYLGNGGLLTMLIQRRTPLLLYQSWTFLHGSTVRKLLVLSPRSCNHLEFLLILSTLQVNY